VTTAQDVVPRPASVERAAKSRLPAILDLLQSGSGLVLGLFMWLHMLFVSSILLGEDAMWTVARAFEGQFLFGKPYPALVAVAVAGVFLIFIAHAGLAMRKFPSSYRQYSVLRRHMKNMQHGDTNLWFVQVYTGFAMFFLGSVHLYTMLTHPAQIGPYESADRMVSAWMWPLYLLLLLAVELHGGIGLYRLAVKWGWFEGKNPNATRNRLKLMKWVLTVFWLGLGLTTLAAYMKIGWEHRAQAGEPYVPTHLRAPAPAAAEALP
jgi:fumarate reductase subunit C